MFYEWVYLIILVVTLIISAMLMGISWSRRHTKAGRWFSFLMMAQAWLIVTYLLVAVNDNEAGAFFWLRIRFFFWSVIPLFFLFFALEYSEHGRRIRLPFVLPLLIIPIITQYVIWFAPDHFWATWTIENQGLLMVEHVTYRSWYWVSLAQTFFLFMFAFGYLITYIINTTAPTRRAIIGIISAIILVGLTSTISSFGLNNQLLNPMPIAITIASFVYFWALMRQSLFHIAPVTYKSIIENMQDAVFVFNDDNQLVFFNPTAEHLIYPMIPKINAGQSVYDLFPRNQDIIDLYIYSVEAHFSSTINLPGQELILDIRLSPIVNQYDKKDYKLLILRDISALAKTQKREMELQLEKERRSLLTHFIQNSGHEFKTPLTIIKTNNYLMTRLNDVEKRKLKGAEVEQQITRIMNLVDRISLVARLENPGTLIPERINSQQFFDSLVADIRLKFDDQTILNYQICKSLDSIYGDTSLLGEAFHHIIENAYHVVESDGSIMLDICSSDGMLEVKIQDTGAGLSEDDMKHIFETFWRKDEAHSTEGLGLGLSIAKRVIELHDGTISVSSEQGIGTNFTIRLPFEN